MTSQGEPCRVPPTSRRSAAPAERGTSRRELRAGFASLTPPERKVALGGGETPGGQKEAWVAAGAGPAAKVAKRAGFPLRRDAQRRPPNAAPRGANCAPDSRR